MRYHFVCPVWGTRALRAFLDLGLPSQLAGLSYFGEGATSTYYIYTTSGEADVIKQHEAYGYLTKVMPVEFIIDDMLPSRASWWESFTVCHHWQTALAMQQDAATFFLCADQIWTEHSLTKAALLIEQGWKAVMCAGPRVVEDVARAALVPQVRDGMLRVKGEYLIAHALSDWLHYEFRDSFWDAPNYIKYVSNMMFTVPGEGALAYCYILHPIVVKPQGSVPSFQIFDQDYLSRAVPNPWDIYISQDTTIGHVSLARQDIEYGQPTDDQYRDPIQAQAWYLEDLDALHHTFGRRPISLRYSAEKSDAWEKVHDRADLILASIERILSMPSVEMLYHYPDNLIRRFARRRRYGLPLNEHEEGLAAQAQQLAELRVHRTWTNPMK